MNSAGRLSSGLTPLLDTLFLLLFALLAISDVRREAAREELLVELPAVAPDGASEELPEARVTVVVDADSELRVGEAGAAVSTPRELDAALALALDGLEPERVAIELRADRDSRHGVSVALLQHLRAAGYRDVVLVALQAPDPDQAFDARGGER